MSFHAEYYDNERPKLTYFMKDGELHGNYTEYHKNGNISKLCSYIYGVLNGLYEEFDSDGNIITEEFYLSGEKIN